MPRKSRSEVSNIRSPMMLFVLGALGFTGPEVVEVEEAIPAPHGSIASKRAHVT
jgi:hypothetical protein